MDQETQQPSSPSTSPSNKPNLPIGAIIAVIIVIGAGGFLLLNKKNNKPANQTVESAQITKEPSQAMKMETSVSPSASSSPSATSPSATTTAQNVKEFTVTGSNFAFSPSTLTVNKGDTVKITFKNAAGFHDINFPDFNANTSKISAGQQAIISFVADKTGTFEYYCSVGSHKAMGMKGTLTVQ